MAIDDRHKSSNMDRILKHTMFVRPAHVIHPIAIDDRHKNSNMDRILKRILLRRLPLVASKAGT